MARRLVGTLVVELVAPAIEATLLGASGARRRRGKLHRRGRLFKERYHARPLATPLEVRRAIGYLMTNAAKHDDPIPDPGTRPVDGIDPCSSARWFTGWLRPPPLPDRPAPTAEPRTWLLREGWRRHGLLRRSERPAGD